MPVVNPLIAPDIRWTPNNLNHNTGVDFTITEGHSANNIVLSSPGNGAISLNGNVNVNNALGLSGGGNLNGRGSAGIFFNNTAVLGFGSSSDNVGANDTGISRTNTSASGAAVIQINSGTQSASPTGFINWGGQARVTANATSTTTTMTAVPGMVVNVSTGRTYMFEVNMFTTATTVGGIKAAMSGSAAWTNIRYEGSVLENNTVGGYVVAAAITTNVATLTAAATGFVTIKGLGTVSTAGTLTVNFGQNATAAGATTIQSGSYMIVHDMP